MKYYSLWLSVIIIFFYIFQIFYPGFTESLLLSKNSFNEPWRFVTAIFLHGGLGHLAYNLFALVLFGLILESLIGSRKFLLVFFSTGILANLVSVNFYEASLGASGAIFGIIGALTVIRPLMTVWAFGMPMPMFVASILWTVGNAIQTFVPSDVGTIAHLSGIFFGLLFGALLREKIKRVKRKKIVFDEDSVRRWEEQWMK